jgi:hypothetical protein
MLRVSVILLLFFAGMLCMDSCKDEGCESDTYYLLTPAQKQKFPYTFDRDISLIFSDSTRRDSVTFYRQPLEDILYTNDYSDSYSACTEKHHAEMMRRSFESFDKRHLYQVSLFTEEYVGNLKLNSSVTKNSFLFRLDTMFIHVNESMLAAPGSHLVARYNVLVGKDTAKATFDAAELKSIYIPSKGLTIDIK